MKKLLSSILASSMILSSISTVSFAVEHSQTPRETLTYTQTLSSNEADFTISDSGVITKYVGSGGNVVIPASVNGVTVSSIGASAFQNKTSIESVTMPSTLQRIENNAFDGCSNLCSINLNEGLLFIGEKAFQKTTNLGAVWFPSTLSTISYAAFYQSGITSLYVPATVNSVGTAAFQECIRLTNAIFMPSITTVPEATFYGCLTLEEVYLREGITTIGTSAFRSCKAMKEITLPTTTSKINEYAFYACSKLEKLDFSNTQLTYVDFYAFQYCISLTEAIFPYGFQEFEYGLNYLYTDMGQFIGCTSLEKVVLPSTVNSCYFYIKTYAGIGALVMGMGSEVFNHPFINCHPSLTVYHYGSAEVAKMGTYTNVFSVKTLSGETKNPSLIPATVPQLPTKADMVLTEVTPIPTPNASAESDFVLSAGGVITSYTGSGGNVAIPSTIGGLPVYTIGENAFQGNTTIESVTMPNTLERIDASAFSGCSNLREVDLNEGLQYIGASAFASTRTLGSIWFPSTLVQLGEKAFEHSGLTSLYLPETVRMMGEYVFQECSRLSSVIFMADMGTLPRATFYNCPVLEDVYLREGIVTIGRSAFNSCSSLEQITLPTTTKNISLYAFYNCSQLKTMDMSNTRLSFVDFYAFQYCVSLTEVIFPYGFRTFSYGEQSTDVDKAQFLGCSSLTKVVLPSSLDTCYHYFNIGFSSSLKQPFTDCNPSLVVYGYPDTSVAELATITNSFKFSSLGSVADEDQSLLVTPTTPPQLPTKADLVQSQNTPIPTPNASAESDFVLGDGGVITSYTGSGGDVAIPSTIGGNTVYGIGANAFKGKTSIESVTMPNTLERIESSAFMNCTNLHSVKLNEGLQYIGVSAFDSTTALTSIWFPSTLEELGETSFQASGLTSLYIPETVRILGAYAFQTCSQLRSVIFMGNMDTLPRATFYKCTALTDVYLREGIVTIGRSAFNSCTSLEQITLPTTTKNISLYTFYNCSNLKTMDMSNTRLSFVDFYAFQYCKSLTEVIFPYGFTTFSYGEQSVDVDKAQFLGCSSLTKVVLPSTLDTCYHYFNIGFSSSLKQPFTDSNSDLVVYGYSNTSVAKLATITNSFKFSPLTEENKNPILTPTMPPALPTSPYTAETTSPSSTYPTWASNYIDFIAPVIMPDISPENYALPSNRGLIAQSLYHMCGDGGNYTSPFSDVGNYSNAIGWCYENQVMSGNTSTWFNSAGNVTREQFALILRQLASSQGKDVSYDLAVLSEFPDGTSGNDWAQSGLAWAVKTGLMSGNANGTLNPIGDVSRVEVAVMLSNFNKL